MTPLVQKLSVLSHLPSLFHDHPVDAKSKILPAALIILLSEPAKYQVAAADALLQVISENTIAPKTMQSFIPYCKKLLYQPDCGKWDDLFIACIKSITLDSIDADVY